MSTKSMIWGFWLLLTLIVVSTVFTWMTFGGNRQLLTVGATTDAHHQIEMACETCHAAGNFAATKSATKAMNKSCRNCHDNELAKADDSHPRKKFRSPRMAEYWEKLDARLCTSCHIEHRPELTRESAVTVAMNFCSACHSEGDQDVRTTRASHAGLSFDTCASAGCHNYHDNSSLYADFLVKHAHDEWLAPQPMHQLTALYLAQHNASESQLQPVDAIAPKNSLTDSPLLHEWAGSGHASAGINCNHCHLSDDADETQQAQIEANWINNPGTKVCNDCHKQETKSFRQGRHGMRQHPEVAEPRDTKKQLEKLGLNQVLPEVFNHWLSDSDYPQYITVAESRLPMQPHADEKLVHCGSCHDAHTVDIRHAAVEACLGCHNDEHSVAYKDSIHYSLWHSESIGETAPGTGVSCATCHMPKIKRRGKVITNHNQNDTLRPNEKMIRPVCLDCHGLGFALDSLADEALITSNFKGQSSVQVQSINWALQREKEDQ